VDYNVEVKPTAELVGLSENADAEEVWFLRRPWNDSKYKPPKVLGHLASTIA